VTFAGAIDSTNTAGLAKSGGGTLTLSGDNAYTGETAITTGKLFLNGANDTSAISVAGGTTLGGTGSAASGVATVVEGGIVEAGSGGAGGLTLGGLGFAAGGAIKAANIDNYTSAAAVTVNDDGGLTVDGGAGSVVITLSGPAPTGTGTAHIIQYGGAIGGTGGGFDAFTLNTIGITNAGRSTFTLVDNTGYVDVDYDYSGDHPVWSGAGDGNWITSPNLTVTPPTNWVLASNPLTQTNFIAGDEPVFNDSASGTTVAISAADVTPSSVTFDNTDKDYTLQGDYGITGPAALTKSGSGRLTIATNNTYEGGTTINDGTVQVGVGGTAGSLGTGAIVNDGALEFNRSDSIEVADAISGGGSLTQNGLGTLTLGGANSYEGGTTINAGTLTVNASSTLGSGDLAVNNPNTGDGTAVVLNLNGSASVGMLSGTIATPSSGVNTATINIAGGKTLAVNEATDGAFDGDIAGDGGLTKTGDGKLTLGGANTYTGQTSINGGTLIAASLPNNHNIAFNNGGILEFTGAAGLARLNEHSTSTWNINVTDPDGNLTVSRNSSGHDYIAIAKGGAGTLTVANTWWDDGGDLAVNEGTAVLAGGTNVGLGFANVSSITDVVLGATVKLGNANGGQVWYDSGFDMSGGTFDVNGQNPANAQNTSVPAIDGSGTITNNAAATTGTAVFKINGTKTFSGDIVDGASGTGKVAVTLSTSGGTTPTWILSGINTYSGATTVSSGTLAAGSTTAFSPNSVYTVGATLDLAGNSNQIAGLTGGGTVKSSVGSATLTVNNDVATSDADYTFDGVLRDGTVEEGGGVLGLTKTGSKTLTLSGANAYTGVTTVTEGTLQLNGVDVSTPSAWDPVLNVGGADIQASYNNIDEAWTVGKLVFDYTGGVSPALTIDGLMKASYHGDLYGVGLWDQGQFRSTTAATTGLTLGWADVPTQVTVMATYAGDANLDGEVDGADVDIWKLNVGTTGVGVWELADFNYDGEVDGADVDIWKLKVGSSMGLSGGGMGLSASIVPEPGTLILLVTGLLGLPCYAWRRRRS
jgi:autotransporter-associated beta strand protein